MDSIFFSGTLGYSSPDFGPDPGRGDPHPVGADQSWAGRVASGWIPEGGRWERQSEWILYYRVLFIVRNVTLRFVNVFTLKRGPIMDFRRVVLGFWLVQKHGSRTEYSLFPITCHIMSRDAPPWRTLSRTFHNYDVSLNKRENKKGRLWAGLELGTHDLHEW